jgi:hypothetical protein
MGNTGSYNSSFENDDFYGSGYSGVPELDVLDQKVRFSLKNCTTGKKCFSKVSDRDARKSLYSTLGHFEEMTWRQLQELKHEKGISIEKKGSDNYKKLVSNYKIFETFGHFRVSSKKKPKFRVFGARLGDLFYLLEFDPDGKENH